MQRFLLLHENQRIPLPDGETVIGRGLRCRIRFNDPTISRAHLRIVVHAGRATVVNLSSNGTLLNGKRLGSPRQLASDDVVRIGYRTIKIAVVEDASEPSRSLRRATHDDLLLAESIDEENTRPGEDGWRKRASSVRDNTQPMEALAGGEPVVRQLTPQLLSSIAMQLCPSCHTRNASGHSVCAACGHAWPPSHPSGVTLEIPIEELRPRREPRYRVEVPILYASSTLSIDATVRDISRGGMFIATRKLDPIGTLCELTALPNGHPAMAFSGAVVHVADHPSPSRTSGLGVRIVGGSEAAMSWLERTLARFAEAIVED